MVAPLEIVYRPIADLIPYVRNSRTHSDAQIAQIAASIREFGWTNPVLTDGQRGVIAGHGRILAARKLGIEQVPCIELAHMSAAQKRAYVIADNQLAANASWDLDMLRVEVGDLTTEGFDVSLLGFDSDFMESLMAPAVTEGITDPDEVPDVPRGEPASVPGDLWIMGRHRLVCGDCTVVDVIDRVMPEKKADLCLHEHAGQCR